MGLECQFTIGTFEELIVDKKLAKSASFEQMCQSELRYILAFKVLKISDLNKSIINEKNAHLEVSIFKYGFWYSLKKMKKC